MTETETRFSSDDENVTNIGNLSVSFSLEGQPDVASDQDSSDEETHQEHARSIVKSAPIPSSEVFMPTPIHSALKSTVASPADRGWSWTAAGMPLASSCMALLFSFGFGFVGLSLSATFIVVLIFIVSKVKSNLACNGALPQLGTPKSCGRLDSLLWSVR